MCELRRQHGGDLERDYAREAHPKGDWGVQLGSSTWNQPYSLRKACWQLDVLQLRARGIAIPSSSAGGLSAKSLGWVDCPGAYNDVANANWPDSSGLAAQIAL